MAIIFIVSAVLHTTALTAKAGAWNIVLAKRYRRRATSVCVPRGAEWRAETALGSGATRLLTHAPPFLPFIVA